MLSEEFDEDEYFYRAIPTEQWIHDEDRPSSAAFRPSTPGCSVDRSAKRTVQEAKRVLLQMIHSAEQVVTIEKKQCDEEEIYAEYLPIPNNEFHSELFNSKEEKKRLTKTQTKRLVKLCIKR